MSNSFIVPSRTEVELNSAPIEPSWIIDGNPVARNAILSKSADGSASTIVWHCTEGKFKWHYNIDETIYVIEGSVVIESDNMKPTRFGPGDVVFFRKGATARWHVEGHIRKLAFCRRTQPRFVALALRVASKLRSLFFSGDGKQLHSLLSAG